MFIFKNVSVNSLIIFFPSLCRFSDKPFRKITTKTNKIKSSSSKIYYLQKIKNKQNGVKLILLHVTEIYKKHSLLCYLPVYCSPIETFICLNLDVHGEARIRYSFATLHVKS